MKYHELLTRHAPRELPVGAAVPAAVLVPLCAAPEGERVLFLKRAAAPDAHGGQFAFPGGKVDREDRDRVHTALREAWEEVGIRPEDVRVLGRLDAQVTMTGFHITPVVGRIPWPYAYALNPVEVDRILEVPLAMLLDPGFIQLTEREFAGRLVRYYHFQVGADTIWGATARIVRQLVQLLQGDPLPLAAEVDSPLDP